MALSTAVATGWNDGMRRPAVLLLAILLAACSGAPNLDEALPGQSEAAVRDAVAGHLGWDEKLSDAELDQVATFLVTYAGSDTPPPAADPGLTVWRANDCARCHTLAAGEEASGS